LLLIAADLAKMPILSAMRALLPFYAISIAVVALAVFFPDLMLWVSRHVMPNFMH
jgi:TRAP-type C4-dicarboxylate transport system permease large subunit